MLPPLAASSAEPSHALPPPTDRELRDLRDMLPFDINNTGQEDVPLPQQLQAEENNADNSIPVDFDYDLRQLERELEGVVISTDGI